MRARIAYSGGYRCRNGRRRDDRRGHSEGRIRTSRPRIFMKHCGTLRKPSGSKSFRWRHREVLLTADADPYGGLRDIAYRQFLDFDPGRRDQDDPAINDRGYGIAGALMVAQRFAHGLSGRSHQCTRVEAKFAVPASRDFPASGLGRCLSHIPRGVGSMVRFGRSGLVRRRSATQLGSAHRSRNCPASARNPQSGGRC